MYVRTLSMLWMRMDITFSSSLYPWVEHRCIAILPEVAHACGRVSRSGIAVELHVVTHQLRHNNGLEEAISAYPSTLRVPRSQMWLRNCLFGLHMSYVPSSKRCQLVRTVRITLEKSPPCLFPLEV